MIIATITAITFLLHGGVGFSFDIFNEAIVQVVQEQSRVNQIYAITAAADEEMEALNDFIAEKSKDFDQMNKRHDVTRAEMDNFLNLIDLKYEAYQETIIAYRFQAKSKLSREEWDAVYTRIKT